MSNEKKVEKLSNLSFAFFSLALLFLTFSSHILYVNGSSMEPTFSTNDTVIALKDTGKPKVGQIAAFVTPEEWGYKSNYLKRVLAVPGDHIVMDNGRLTINSEEILNRKYCSVELDTTLGEDQYLVKGDNGSNSIDSIFRICMEEESFTISESDFITHSYYYIRIGDWKNLWLK